jgi:hypothetical protein
LHDPLDSETYVSFEEDIPCESDEDEEENDLCGDNDRKDNDDVVSDNESGKEGTVLTHHEALLSSPFMQRFVEYIMIISCLLSSTLVFVPFTNNLLKA